MSLFIVIISTKLRKPVKIIHSSATGGCILVFIIISTKSWSYIHSPLKAVALRIMVNEWMYGHACLFLAFLQSTLWEQSLQFNHSPQIAASSTFILSLKLRNTHWPRSNLLISFLQTGMIMYFHYRKLSKFLSLMLSFLLIKKQLKFAIHSSFNKRRWLSSCLLSSFLRTAMII